MKGGIDYQTEAALRRANRLHRAQRYKVERYMEEQAMEQEDEGERTVREIIRAWFQLVGVIVGLGLVSGFIWGKLFG